jgi:hypothetical protein
VLCCLQVIVLALQPARSVLVALQSESTSATRRASVTAANTATTKFTRYTLVTILCKQARGTHCEQCLSKHQLVVQLGIPLPELAAAFEREEPAAAGSADGGGGGTADTAVSSGDFDRVVWKRFWMQRQRYETVCVKCNGRAPAQRSGFAPLDSNSDDSDGGSSPHRRSGSPSKGARHPDWGPVFLNAAAKAILLQWYKRAQERLWGAGGPPQRPSGASPARSRSPAGAGVGQRTRRPQSTIDVSDDENSDEEVPAAWAMRGVNIDAASAALAIRWLRTARARLQARGNRAAARGAGNGAGSSLGRRFERK